MILLLTEGGAGVTWDPLIEWRDPDGRAFNASGVTLHAFLTARRPRRHDEPVVTGWKVR